jgi:hypothetical protein
MGVRSAPMAPLANRGCTSDERHHSDPWPGGAEAARHTSRPCGPCRSSWPDRLTARATYYQKALMSALGTPPPSHQLGVTRLRRLLGRSFYCAQP